MAKDQELDYAVPPYLHLVSAFLAMDPVDSLLTLARECGGGQVTMRVQMFIWDHCISEAAGKIHLPYLKNFLKKLITEVESSHGDLLDIIYEQYANYMASCKDDYSVEGTTRVCKCVSFLFPDDSSDLSSCPKSRKLVVPLQCSLNMLEGDTGCSIWPSSLYLSELILSFPEIFSERSCVEVGSGVGLVGICLNHVKSQRVVLSDGDLSTLANLKVNLELNGLNTGADTARTSKDPNMVECIHLQWESVSESELGKLMPDIVLGADVIYDPEYLPHLVRVLKKLLDRRTSYLQKQDDYSNCSSEESKCFNGKVCYGTQESGNDGNGFDACQGKSFYNGVLNDGPVAYIASVIRNRDTFNHFLRLVEQANLTITVITDQMKPLNLLPYMYSYDRSTIQLFTVTLN